MVPARSRRHDDAAAAVVEDDVGAVGLGEPWRGLEEFLGIHSLLWTYLESGRHERISVSIQLPLSHSLHMRIEERGEKFGCGSALAGPLEAWLPHDYQLFS